MNITKYKSSTGAFRLRNILNLTSLKKDTLVTSIYSNNIRILRYCRMYTKKKKCAPNIMTLFDLPYSELPYYNKHYSITNIMSSFLQYPTVGFCQILTHLYNI